MGYISVQKLESDCSKSFAVCISLQTKAIKVSLGAPGLENIPQVPENWAEVGENHGACKAVSATLWVVEKSWSIFRSRSSKLSVKNLFLCPFHFKPRPPRVSLESLGLENISQLMADRAKVAQNHDARKAVSATLSVLKLRGAIFPPRSSRPGVR